MNESFVDRFRRWYALQPVALRTLMAISVVVYVAWLFLSLIPGVAEFVHQYLAFHPQFPDFLVYPWQIVTYSFIHTQLGFWGLINLAFALLWLFWIGKDFEEMQGPQKMLGLYAASVLGGALLMVLMNAVIPTPNAVAQTAWPAAIGVLWGVATMYPQKSLGLLFLGVVPLRYIAIGFLVIETLLYLPLGPVWLSVHWGGALGGYLFARAEMRGVNLSGWAEIFFRPRTKSARSYRQPPSDASFLDRIEARLARKESEKSHTPNPRMKKVVSDARVVHEVNQAEVDRILDKILQEGYDALTKAEKRILDEASKK